MIWTSAARRLKQLPLLFDAPPQLRRAHERHDVTASVTIAVAGRTGEHHTVDVSHGGVLVQPPVPAHAGDSAEVSAGSLLTGAPAIVIGHRAGGTALRFDSDRHGALLTAWLMRQ